MFVYDYAAHTGTKPWVRLQCMNGLGPSRKVSSYSLQKGTPVTACNKIAVVHVQENW